MAVEDELTIGEAARLAGVAASTLRYWETAGLLEAPRRVGGKRRYDREGLQRMEMVALAKRAGFTLAEIRVILSGVSDRTPPSEVWRRLASDKLPEVEQTLVEAQAMKRILEAGLRCECLSLEVCLAGTGRQIAENIPSGSLRP
jgi:MerR family redox-sensitive transcriptional activator SoxR